VNIKRCLCGLGNKIKNLVDNNVHMYKRRARLKTLPYFEMPKHEGRCLSDECFKKKKKTKGHTLL
jgi:hypothetical protein